ncbi:MAG: hypothetical protein WC848_06035 [Parcubacteria group bacterium]|jgi:FMN phosphatase YigB (HAD superfamily)
MKIFIDFDDAIFNTKKFKHDFIAIFGRYGINQDEFQDSYYTYSNKSQIQGRHYDFKMQVKTLQKSKGIDGKKLKADVEKFMQKLNAYLLPDVKTFLQEFPKKDLFILSYGEPKFQKAKIRGAGIDRLVNRVFITKRKKVDVILELNRKYAYSKKEAIILIDDHPDQFEIKGKARERITTFHLSRKEGRYHDLPCEERDYAVKNLGAVVRIIKKEKMQ